MSYLPRVNPAPSCIPEEARKHAARIWVKLRPTLGSAAAARKTGHSETQLTKWCRNYGIEIPAIKRSNVRTGERR